MNKYQKKLNTESRMYADFCNMNFRAARKMARNLGKDWNPCNACTYYPKCPRKDKSFLCIYYSDK